MNRQLFNDFLGEVGRRVNPENQTFLVFDNAPAHRNADCPRGRIEIKMLPPYSPFLNIVEQAISALKAAIKADISRPEIQATIDDRDEARRQGIPFGEYRQRILLEASQRNMNPLRLQSAQGGTDSCRHMYRVVLTANTLKVKNKLCLLWTVMYLPVMTFKKCKRLYY